MDPEVAGSIPANGTIASHHPTLLQIGQQAASMLLAKGAKSVIDFRGPPAERDASGPHRPEFQFVAIPKPIRIRVDEKNKGRLDAIDAGPPPIAMRALCRVLNVDIGWNGTSQNP